MNSKLPTFTIVVPCYNTEKTIKGCIESLMNLKYPKDLYKVIVVNDGSVDNTKKVLDSLNYDQVEIVHLRSNRGPANARNIGMEKADSDYVLLVDDTVIDENNLLNFVASIRKYPKSLFSGEIKYFGTKNVLSKMIEKANIFPMRSGKSGNLLWASTNNLCIPKEVYRSTKFDTGFRLAAGEDVEFCFRVRQKGYKIMFNDKAIIYHESHANIKSTIKRAFRYGKGTSSIINKSPEKGFFSISILVKFLLLTSLFFVPLFVITLQEVNIVLIPIVYLVISSYYYFSSYYIRRKIYREGTMFSLQLSLFRNLIVWIYQMGIFCGNIQNRNPLFSDLVPCYMNKNASKGLSTVSALNDLLSVTFSVLILRNI